MYTYDEVFKGNSSVPLNCKLNFKKHFWEHLPIIPEINWWKYSFTMEFKLSIVKMSNDNYLNWKFWIVLLLRKELHWLAITKDKSAETDIFNLKIWTDAELIFFFFLLTYIGGKNLSDNWKEAILLSNLPEHYIDCHKWERRHSIYLHLGWKQNQRRVLEEIPRSGWRRRKIIWKKN